MRKLNLEKNRILLVTQDANARESMWPALREHSVMIAHDPDQGIRIAKHGFFDLYILDNRLPARTGVELGRRIRHFDPNTPIIFYAGPEPPQGRSEALKGAAQLYFHRPADGATNGEDLQRVVAKLLLATSHWVFGACEAAVGAVSEELAGRQNEVVSPAGVNPPEPLRANQRQLRRKAEAAFLGAGGARGDFARLWPAIYEDASQRASKPADAPAQTTPGSINNETNKRVRKAKWVVVKSSPDDQFPGGGLDHAFSPGLAAKRRASGDLNRVPSRLGERTKMILKALVLAFVR
jgi:CheY-like chemotaxis protein